MNQTNEKIRERVLRKKAAHTEDDVLENNSRLKRIFSHVDKSPTMQRFDMDFSLYLGGCIGKKGA